jgi:hypothetical protein
MHDAAATQFPNRKVKSILADLPVAKATNTYTRVVNGRLELAPGESGTPRSKDRFCFRFWPISTKHVDTINSIFLDNLLRCNSIVFGSTPPFRRTLEAYMTTRAHGFKAPTSKLLAPKELVSQSAKLCREKMVHKGNCPFREIEHLTGAGKWSGKRWTKAKFKT